MNVSVRDVNPEVFKRFKSEVVKESIKTGTALTQAMQIWLENKTKKKKKKSSLLSLKPFDWKAERDLSERVDEVLYGWRE